MRKKNKTSIELERIVEEKIKNLWYTMNMGKNDLNPMLEET